MLTCRELHCRPMPDGMSSRSHCTVCHRDFKSHSVGDAHRVGDFGPERHCLSEADMMNRGWRRDSDGWWGGPPMTDAERARIEAIKAAKAAAQI